MVAAATRQDRAGLDCGHAREGASRIPSSRQATSSRLSRAFACRLKSSLMWIARAPARFAIRSASSTGSPLRMSAGAALAQGPVEIAQAVEQVGDTIRRSAATRQQSVVEHEQRHDTVCLTGGRRQGRLVTDAEVSGEENYDAAQFTVDKPGTRLELATPSLPWKCSTN